MQDSTVHLLLGITFGFAVVGLVIGLTLLVARAQPAVVLSANNGYTYKNNETWSVVKDADGRIKDITVHREASGT